MAVYVRLDLPTHTYTAYFPCVSSVECGWLDRRMVGWLTGWRDIILEYGIQNTHRIHRFVYIQTKNCKLLFHVLICCALLCFAFVRWVYEILLISRYSAPANSLNNALERNGTCLKKPRLEERISYRKENGKLFFLFSCSFFSSIEKNTHFPI